MSRSVVLKNEVTLDREYGYVTVRLMRVTLDAGSKWPVVEKIDYKRIQLQSWTGSPKSAQTIAKAIVKAQNNMLAHFKKHNNYLNHVEKLVTAYNGGEIVIEDPKTGKMVDFFVKAKK